MPSTISPSIYLPQQNGINTSTITLAASKSISNRALIIDALCVEDCKLLNLSEARDTKIMADLLSQKEELLNVQDAGTTMRFLIAYLALTNNKKQLTGTKRMQLRPVKVLVSALKQIGAKIEYLGIDGYPPLQINGFQEQLVDEISIAGNISSQYISALLMMAPGLPRGLRINIQGPLWSAPYVRMTLKLMEWFGVHHQWEGQLITVLPQQYKAREFSVESDWSAASYWYSAVALSDHGEITLNGLENHSLQGDRQVADLMKPLGVVSQFHENGVTLIRCPRSINSFSYNFASCPDLAQTVFALCAVIGVTCKATGLESLKIKETDRILALQTELGKFGADLVEHETHWELIPTTQSVSETLTFHTYEDHRMAMALAPLALRFPLVIEDPKVVEKSYPGFWRDLTLAGLISTEALPDS